MGIRALITGSGGFQGRHTLAEARARGIDAVGIDLVGGLDALAVDLRDRAAVARALDDLRPELVVHLAGVLRSDAPEGFYAANAIATVVLLDELAKRRRGTRVVVVSSSAVYGPSTADRVSEDHPLRPLGHYGASKVAQEHAALAMHAMGALDVVVARTFNVVGPGQPPTLAASRFARQIAAVERGEQDCLRTGDLGGVRDLVDVRDVARAYLDLAERGEGGAVYNVCTGVGTTMQACLDELSALARHPIRVEREVAAGRAPEIPAQIGDPSRIAAQIGWTAEIPLARSLADLLDDWRGRTEGSR